MSKSAILKAGFAAIHYSGFAKLLGPFAAGQGFIFCMHHVCPQGGKRTGFAPNANLEVAPEFLDGLIALMKVKNIDLISLDEALQRLKSPDRQRRFAVFTLDDGYRDNLVYAMPVFEKHNCPFTVYVAPRIAEGTCELWWRLLEAIIAKSDAVKCEIVGALFDLDTSNIKLKNDAWRKLAPKLQAMDEYAQRETIRALCDRYSVDWNLLCRNAAMTWDEIRRMAQNPLATIGAHTLNHYNLLKLSSADAEAEMLGSKQQIEFQLGQTVKHFAYPYGNVDAAGPREFALCKAAGFETSVVTRLGVLWPEHVQHIHALPRIMISSRYQNHSAIEALVSGVPALLANRFKRLNVA
jgi:peptidoglycan/xylan/chitin deacetylase (PgdA/CDA1 family)